MIDKEINFLVDVAHLSAERSKDLRKKVGAVIADSNGRIISTGYNGTYAGGDNACQHVMSDGTLVTKDETIHAEENAILYAARRGIATDGAYMVTTLSPCSKCCARMIQAGIRDVFYIEQYRLFDEVQTEFGNRLNLYQLAGRK